MSRFSLAKDRVGAYFGNGEAVLWAQMEARKRADPQFVEAVEAASRVFFRILDADVDPFHAVEEVKS